MPTAPARPKSRGPAPAPTAPAVAPVAPRSIADIDDPNSPIDIGDIDAPAAPQKRQTAPASPGFASSSSTAVKSMQQAILDFASTISNIDLNSIRSQDKAPDSFGNFLSEQYLGSTEPGALDSIAKQMKMIGIPGQHDKTDGVWGRNTNQALKNIISVSKGMFGLSKDLQYPLQGYTEEQLESFEKLVPGSYTDLKNPNDKEARAKEITNHIKNLTRLFRRLKEDVMKNPQLKSVVEKKKIFLNIPQSAKIGYNFLNDEEKAILEQYKTVPIGSSKVTMRDLISVPQFHQYMRLNKMNPDNIEEVNKALEEISSAISAG